MSAPGDEFDDFLRRRKPLFDRSHDDDVFEPPAELDRVVLRQAREAIQEPRPQRVYRSPRWSAPFAIAATLAVAFTVVWQLMPKHRIGQQTKAEVSMQNASRNLEAPVEALPVDSAAGGAVDAISDAPTNDGTVVVQLAPASAEPAMARERRATAAPAAPPARDALVSDAEADRYSAPPPPAPVLAKRRDSSDAITDSASIAGALAPAYRRDEKAWQVEIKRLRAAGDAARADLEQAEFNRQHRAYASGPDR